jgi:hypothetical protein
VAAQLKKEGAHSLAKIVLGTYSYFGSSFLHYKTIALLLDSVFPFGGSRGLGRYNPYRMFPVSIQVKE